ncbi:hypothetical protein MDA_GLEAN10006748 [Myotis davidii]|uniref:Uncharacterized protein n=1 Tax=Myotis davidii TaxID=225400 RepID=L5LJA3_MYODS|nr:hypothetical protein MDA_GLEAN10006748 [Myotis davidii]
MHVGLPTVSLGSAERPQGPTHHPEGGPSHVAPSPLDAPKQAVSELTTVDGQSEGSSGHRTQGRGEKQQLRHPPQKDAPWAGCSAPQCHLSLCSPGITHQAGGPQAARGSPGITHQAGGPHVAQRPHESPATPAGSEPGLRQPPENDRLRTS